MKTKSNPHRLPGYDRQTGRWELVGFACLGFAGIWLAVSAGRQATNFAVERDTIAASLSGEPVLAMQQTATNHAITNLSALPSGNRVNQPACAGVSIRPI